MLNTFDRIKSIFPTVVHRSEDASSEYDWYETHDGTTFGLPKSELSKRERQLLDWWASSVMTTTDSNENKWRHRLQDDDFHLNRPFRLLSLSLQGAETESLEQFLDVLRDFMPHATVIALTRRHVELIETDSFVDILEFEDVLRAIASDFYVEAHVVYSQRPIGNLATLYRQHQLLLPFARLSTKAYPASQLLYHYLLQDHETFEERLRITSPMFEVLDSATVELLEALFNHSLNVSHTAKALFMHRNTLNYRLERLYEATGYDARQFYDASLLQLIVTLHKSD